MRKKFLALLIVLAMLPPVMAVEPTFTDHRNFTTGFVGWSQSPNSTWGITIDDYAKTILNTTNSQTTIGFENATNISTLGLGESSEIDFSTEFKITSEYTIEQTTPQSFYYMKINEKNGSFTYTISVEIGVTSYGYWSGGDKGWEIHINSITLYLKKDGVLMDTSNNDVTHTIIYQEYQSRPEYIYTVTLDIYQINYGGTTTVYLSTPITKQLSVSTTSFIPDTMQPSITVSYPNTLYNATHNLTFMFPYLNIDVYAESYHQIVTEPEPEKPFSFFDVISLPVFSFAVLLIAVFILSVSEKVNIPDEIGYLALLSALAIILFSVVKYYSGNDALSALAGLSPYIGYPLKDKFLNRKKMLR